MSNLGQDNAELEVFINKFNELKLRSQKLYDVIVERDNIEELQMEIDKLLSDPAFKKDISSDQDLTIALMNLIGIEEHLFFTGAKTEKTSYYDLILPVREIRKSLLGKIIKKYEGEVWCISKHLLAASYRLMEVGTKQLSLDRKTEAYDFFEKAYELYCLFWGINMQMFSGSDTPNEKEQQIDKSNFEIASKFNEITGKGEVKSEATVMSKFKKLVKKVVDCCIE